MIRKDKNIVRLLRVTILYVAVGIFLPFHANADLLSMSFWENATVEEVTELLAQPGLDITKTGGWGGYTALAMASQISDNPELVKLLLKAGKGKFAQKYYDHALLVAALYNKNIENSKLLIEAGANANARAGDGRTILIKAGINASNPAIIKVLVDGGADLNTQDGNGLTALMGAVYLNRYNPEGMTNALLDAGADVSIKDSNGSTAWELNENRGYIADTTKTYKKLKKASGK